MARSIGRKAVRERAGFWDLANSATRRGVRKEMGMLASLATQNSEFGGN